MRLLVAGGAGFIGSNFIRYWLHHHPDDQIVNLDKLTYAGNLANLRDVENDPRYRFVRGDVARASHVEAAMGHGVDFVVNFAAETHVDRSILGADSFIRTDVLGTYRLLTGAREVGVRRYLQVSTDEVYGSVPEGSSRETDPLRPSNPYSASKAGGDHVVHSFFVTYGLDTVITRGSNNFGPYQYPEKVIPLFVTNLLEGKKVPLYGDGMNVRDWIYVLDHVRGIETALLRGKAGEVYNIGGGNEVSNIDLTRMILRELELDESSIERVTDRPGHDRRYSLDTTKIRSLGWQPAVPFEEALRKTIQWYRDHQEWWKPLKSGEYLDYYRRQYEDVSSQDFPGTGGGGPIRL
jgi:dTDP-glucose 4,6-dehydratase